MRWVRADTLYVACKMHSCIQQLGFTPQLMQRGCFHTCRWAACSCKQLVDVLGQPMSMQPSLRDEVGFVHLTAGNSKPSCNVRPCWDVLQVFRLSYPYQEDLRNWGNVSQEAQESVFSMPSHVFYELYPFHLILDANLRLVQAGPAIRRVIPELQAGEHIRDHFRVGHLQRTYHVYYTTA